MGLDREYLRSLNVPEENIQDILDVHYKKIDELNETLVKMNAPLGMTEDEALKKRIVEIGDTDTRQKAILENIHLFK